MRQYGRKGEIKAPWHSTEIFHYFCRTVHAVVVRNDADFKILSISVINGFKEVYKV